MSFLDSTVEILSRTALKDSVVKILHTAATNLKVGDEDAAFKFSTNLDEKWDNFGVVPKKESSKYKRKSRNLDKHPFAPSERVSGHPHLAATMLAADTGDDVFSNPSVVEDVRLLVGSTEIDNPWRDYNSVSNTIASSVQGPLRGLANGSKRASIGVRYSEATPSAARRSPITALCLANVNSPPPPLLERVDLSLSRRHRGILRVPNVSNFTPNTEAATSDKNGVDAKDSGTTEIGPAKSSDVSVCIHTARAGNIAPAIERIGLVAPSKELLPEFSSEILRKLDGSPAFLQGNQHNTNVRLCFYRAFQKTVKRVHVAGISGDAKKGAGTISRPQKKTEDPTTPGDCELAQSVDLSCDEVSPRSVLALLTGMLLTSFPHLVKYALQYGLAVAQQCPNGSREAFAAQVAAQAVHIANVLGKDGRIIAQKLMCELVTNGEGSLSLTTRTRLTMASLLLLEASETSGFDPNTWRVLRANIPLRRHPEPNSEIIGELYQGDEIVALERKGVWLRHTRGWVQALFHPSGQPSNAPKPKSPGTDEKQSGPKIEGISDEKPKSPPRSPNRANAKSSGSSAKIDASHPMGRLNVEAVGFFKIIEYLSTQCSSIRSDVALDGRKGPFDPRVSNVHQRRSSGFTKGKIEGKVGQNVADTDGKAYIKEEIQTLVNKSVALVETHNLNLTGHPSCTYAFCDAAAAAAANSCSSSSSADDGNLYFNEEKDRNELLVSVVLCLAQHCASSVEFAAGGFGGLLGAWSGTSDDKIWGSGEGLKAIRCIRALTRLLDSGSEIFLTSETNAQLFRRGLLQILSPLFANESLPTIITQMISELFLVIYRKYRSIAKGEIAVFLNEGILPRVRNSMELIPTRTCLLIMILDILKVSETESVVLFYNFDADFGTPGISLALRGSPRLRGVLFNLVESCIQAAMEGLDERHATATGGASPSVQHMQRRMSQGTTVSSQNSIQSSHQATSSYAQLGKDRTLEDSETPPMQRTALQCIHEIARQSLKAGGMTVNADGKNGDRLVLAKAKSRHFNVSASAGFDLSIPSPIMETAETSSSAASSKKKITSNPLSPLLESKELEAPNSGVQSQDQINSGSVNSPNPKLPEADASGARHTKNVSTTCAANSDPQLSDNVESGSVHSTTSSNTGISTMEISQAERSRSKCAETEKRFEKALALAKEIYSNRHSEDEKVQEKAGRAVKDSVKYLLKHGITSPRIIADFLFNNAHRGEHFGKDLLAEYLASGDDEFHLNLRRCYADRIDLSKLDFVQALRLFLGDCGFLIVNLESAKVVRMMELFARTYRRDNPLSPVRSVDAAHTLASMVMAVHTGLWNLKARKQSPPPAADAFASYLRGSNTKAKPSETRPLLLQLPNSLNRAQNEASPKASPKPSPKAKDKNDAEGDFPLSFLMRQYKDIQTEEMKSLGISGSSGESNGNIGDAKGKMALRSTRRLRARLRCLSLPLLKFWPTETLSIANQQSLARIMLEDIYGALWRAVNCIIHGSDRIDSTHYCLDIIAYGLLLAIRTRLDTEFQGFLESLAERTFVESELGKQDQVPGSRRKKKNNNKSKSLADRLLRREHLHRQTWFKRVKGYYRDAAKQPAGLQRAMRMILLEVSLCKSKVRQRKQTEALRRLQKFFGHKIFLISSKRIFLKSAKLVKISEKGQKKPYTFFLFNDLLIYAHGSKVHQTLHLSLATVKDFPRTLRHYLISPQKSFLIEYPSESIKREWMLALEKHIEEQRTAHHAHALHLKQHGLGRDMHSGSGRNELNPPSYEAGKAGAHTSSGEYETDPEITSSFFNVEDSTALHEQQSNRAWVCKLCIRVHSTSRWRSRPGQAPPNGVSCSVCGDVVCKRCATKQLRIRGGPKSRVCDCCYGVIRGDVSDPSVHTEVPSYFSTRTDWSQSIQTFAAAPQHSAANLYSHGLESKQNLPNVASS